jgi:hypothetical protein
LIAFSDKRRTTHRTEKETIQKGEYMKNLVPMLRKQLLTGGTLWLALCAGTFTRSPAADLEILADTPISFRANFIGTDTDPFSLGAGNDFATFVTDYWTLLLNLRADAVDPSGNYSIFYEIILTHTGKLTPKKLAPDVHVSSSATVPAGTVLEEEELSSALNGGGQELLSTTTVVSYNAKFGVVDYIGTIAGDCDLDGNGVTDAEQFANQPVDDVVKGIKNLRTLGLITGREQGRIIKETNQDPK